jgi:hypothetical protein
MTIQVPDNFNDLSLKGRQKAFKTSLLSSYSRNPASTVDSILKDLKKETGITATDLALWLGKTKECIYKWRKNNTNINTIRSAARYIKFEWSFVHRNRFEFDREY